MTHLFVRCLGCMNICRFNAIREDRLKEVGRAAQALVDDTFSG